MEHLEASDRVTRLLLLAFSGTTPEQAHESLQQALHIAEEARELDEALAGAWVAPAAGD